MLVVDTNILVYAADADSAWHEEAHEWIERRRSEPDAWYMTWSILYEFLRVTTHPRVMRKPWKAGQAMTFLSALLASPGLSVLAATERHAGVAAQVVAELPWLAGNLIHDAHTAILMREHGVSRICTRDADFHRFPFVQVVDPLRGAD